MAKAKFKYPQKPKVKPSSANSFIRRTANEWIELAKKQLPPKMLFSEFWHEDELCILFSDTNLGKTILGVQIANSIASGKAIAGFLMEAYESKVLYLDLELSAKQFELRYSDNYSGHYVFSDNLERIEINPEHIPEGDVSEKINKDMEDEIISSEGKIIVVDNITWLRSNNETTKDALPLMKHLKQLKQKYGLSILALAHTPKRDLTRPITGNDLAGSRMLMNFCDSSFAIGGSSQDSGKRYLKQVKARATSIVYGFDNVIVCDLHKETNFLGFEYLIEEPEGLHLKTISEDDIEVRNTNILEALKLGTDKVKIALDNNVSRQTVYNILKKSDLK